MKAQITLILLALVGGSAYAAHMEETAMPVSNDMNVTAPHQSGTWSFGAEAVLLQPMNQAFAYANLFTITGEGTIHGGTMNDYQNVNPGYHWWFGADISYGFPGAGRDVTLAYEGLRANDTADAASPVTDTSYVSPLGGEYTAAEGEVNIRYDAADLLLGQKLDVGQRIGLHPFIGLRYAYMNVKDTANYTGEPEPTEDGQGTRMDQVIWNSTFNGIGPRFGSDAAINLGQGFSIRGRLGLSVLVGSTNPDFKDSYQVYVDATGDLADFSDYSADHGSSTHVIPEIDGRLGLNYTYNFDSNMALGVEAGWQASNYFNVIYQLSGYDGTVTSTNFGLQGPYGRLQLDIA